MLIRNTSTMKNRDRIYSKTLTEGLKIEFYRSENDSAFVWELDISSKQKHSDIKFQINKNNLEKSHILGNRANFHELFNIIDAFFNPEGKSLLVLMDKFGQVDLYEFSLNSDYIFDISHSKINTKHFKTYEIIPMDVELLREDIQDVKLYQNNLHSVSVSLYGNYGSYFFNTLDFDKNVREELILNMSEVKDKAINIEEESINSITTININNHHLVIPILEDIKEKSSYKGKRLSYSYFLETKSSKIGYAEKKKRDGLTFFFIEIDNSPKIMIYDGLRNWYITDYHPSLKTKDDISDFTVKNIDSIIQIRY